MKTFTIHDLATEATHFKQGLISKEDFEELIFLYVSNKKEIIPNMLRILEIERETSQELLSDCNMELGRSLSGLEDFSGQSERHKTMRIFMIAEIKKFYMKWKDKIKSPYKIKDLD